MCSLPSQPPPSLKPVSHYLKVALEHDTRDRVIAYWARFAAVQKSLSIDKSSPEAKMFVIKLLEWLEMEKKELAGNEAITIEAAGEAHIENYALKLFNWADQSDRRGDFSKNVVKAFYTSGILFDVLESLKPPLSEEFTSARKYAKWKAAYIHNCLKNGEVPIPGEGTTSGTEDDEDTPASSHPYPQDPAPSSSYGFVTPGNASDPSHHQNWTNQPQIPSNDQDPPDPINKFLNFDRGGDNSWGGGNNNGNASNTNPYAFQPPPPPQVTPSNPEGTYGGVGASATTTGSLSVEQIAKAQKYCKWAGSALNFDDVNSAIENLEKALHLLKTGQEV